MAAAGFDDVRIVEVTDDYLIEPAMLDDRSSLLLQPAVEAARR